MNIISNIISNSVSGMVEAGTRTVGGYAGDALIRAGDVIEDKGRNMGRGVENAAAGYGSKISGQAPAPGAIGGLPKTPVPKKALQRSHSTPAGALPSTKQTKALPSTTQTKALPSTAASTAVGAAKTTSSAATGSAKRTPAVARSASTALPKTAAGGARSALGSGASEKGDASTDAQRRKQRKKKTRELPKAYPNNVPYPSSKASPVEPNKGPGSAKGDSRGAKDQDNKDKYKPRPYPNPDASSYPTEKKVAVKPGQPRPFVPPAAPLKRTNSSPSVANAKAGSNGAKGPAGNKDVKPYPGTSTLPGQGKRTPVRPQIYKPAERYQPPVEHGKVQHIGIEA